MSNEAEFQVEMGSVRLVRYIAEHLPEPSRMAVQHLD